MNDERLLTSIAKYYSDKVHIHGPTPHGVDWNSRESQQLRFVQLMKVVETRQHFSINDYGCGYGALVDYLSERSYSFRYYGYDISRQMIAKAKEIHSGMPQSHFVIGQSSLTVADYTVASGVFNVKLEVPSDEWAGHVEKTLEAINGVSRKGFAFNILTSHADRHLMRRDLYYADPASLFEYCIRRFSRFVSLIHDYPLYEFTILVRKE
ncbi:MAG TPA: class I SAM-dependent methyltransferase [Pyrinomonadaceae bacterium]|nr:class I SAM-dependent methyltransferase [Pyrinomonadaceae bacterium]